MSEVARLGHAGFQVSTASDGEHALQAVRCDPPDLLLIQPRIRHLTGYRLEPLDDSRTLVTSYYDWSEIAKPC